MVSSRQAPLNNRDRFMIEEKSGFNEMIDLLGGVISCI